MLLSIKTNYIADARSEVQHAPLRNGTLNELTDITLRVTRYNEFESACHVFLHLLKELTQQLSNREERQACQGIVQWLHINGSQCQSWVCEI